VKCMQGLPMVDGAVWSVRDGSMDGCLVHWRAVEVWFVLVAESGMGARQKVVKGGSRRRKFDLQSHSLGLV